MYLFKQVKVEKDTILVGKPLKGDLANLFQQGYQKVLDIMPSALKEKGLARLVRTAGMTYTHIPVEVCDLESCQIDEDWVVRFSRYMNRFSHSPLIINTDDETLGISLVILSNLFRDGKPYQQVIQAVESLGFSLKGRKEIKRFIRIFYTHHKKQITR
jgi:protein tyrosine phosphatase (PTP) superfamily phosphohydrolase (DUF442 family)